MKLDVTQPLKDYEGKDLVVTAGEQESKITLRDVIVNSVNNELPDQRMLAEDKAKAFRISASLYKGKEVSFSVDDLSFIKEKVATTYGPLVYGRVSEIFDGETPAEKEQPNTEG